MFSRMHDRLANLLGVTALAAVDRLRAPVEAELGRGGIAPAVLVHVQAHPGPSIGELQRVLGISQPATVRAVDRLMADGLLERNPGRDRRTLALTLTAAGEAMADRLLAGRTAALREMLATLDEEEVACLEPLLERLTASLAHDRPGALTACRLCDRGSCASGPGCPLQHTVP